VKENAHFLEPVIDVLSSIGLGIVVGLLLGFVEKWLEKSGELLLVVLSGIALNIGIAFLLDRHGILHVDHLLANLFMGMTLINSSTKGEASFKAVKNVDLPIYVLFFVLAGANLHVNQLWTGGILFVIYVIGRTAGKFMGSNIGVRFVGLTQKLGRNVGYGLLPQAGVAIGLAYILKSEDPVMGDTLSIVILSSVMVFELVGPLFTRHAIVKGGEVKEISLSKRLSQSKRRSYHRVLVRLRRSLGFPRSKRAREKKITCNDLLRSSVETIPENMPFDEVLKFASHCKYDHFPVINDDHLLVGTISYAEIRDYLLDPEFSHLVIASDIMRENPPTAYPQDSLQKLLILFHASNDDLDYLPVIDDQDMPHIIGMVTQKDVISAFRKLNKSKSNPK
ncbi:MAG TPA: CBS domain-containing protein, partial [Spirochaetes bacterium]|nr:CBS domain-containing protein [Spirochaetota bacterium]